MVDIKKIFCHLLCINNSLLDITGNTNWVNTAYILNDSAYGGNYQCIYISPDNITQDLPKQGAYCRQRALLNNEVFSKSKYTISLWFKKPYDNVSQGGCFIFGTRFNTSESNGGAEFTLKYSFSGNYLTLEGTLQQLNYKNVNKSTLISTNINDQNRSLYFDKWIHFVLTRNGNYYSMYIDDELKAHVQYTAASIICDAGISLGTLVSGSVSNPVPNEQMISNAYIDRFTMLPGIVDSTLDSPNNKIVFVKKMYNNFTIDN